jgi:hypothetical protein
MSPCSSRLYFRRFGDPYCPHHQGEVGGDNNFLNVGNTAHFCMVRSLINRIHIILLVSIVLELLHYPLLTNALRNTDYCLYSCLPSYSDHGSRKLWGGGILISVFKIRIPGQQMRLSNVWFSEGLWHRLIPYINIMLDFVHCLDICDTRRFGN